MPTPRRFEARLFAGSAISNTAPYRVLPSAQVNSARWSIIRTGGYNAAQLTLNGRRSDFSGLVQGRYVEFWGRDKTNTLQRLYRGRITYIAGGKKRGRSKEADQTTVTLSGVWAKLSRRVIRQRYAYPASRDISTIFAQIAGRWIKGTAASPVVQGVPTDQSLLSIDAWRKYFGDVAGEIVDSAGGFVTCGADVDPQTGYDRVYMRPFDSPDQAYTLVLPDPSLSVTKYEPEEDATGIANGLDIVGGRLSFGNLLAAVTDNNTSFEYPSAITEDTYGELIRDGGFEGTTYPPGSGLGETTLSGITVISKTNGNTNITCSQNIFQGSNQGRVVTITGGTGFNTGDYKIIAVYRATDTPGFGRYLVMLNGNAGSVGSNGGTGILSSVGAWNLSGTAILRQSGQTYGDSDGGNFFVHLINQNDSVYRPVDANTGAISAGKQYRFRVRLRLEKETPTGNVARLTVRWYNTSNAQVGSDTTQTFDQNSGLNTAAAWNTFTLDATCPSGASYARCYVILDTEASGAGGLMVDNMSFTGAGDVVQPGWELALSGTGAILEQDWQYEGVAAAVPFLPSVSRPVHGAYCVRFKVTGSDDTNKVILRPRGAPYISVSTGQTLVLKMWVNRVPTATSRPAIRARFFCFDGSGNFIDSENTSTLFPSTTVLGWQQLVVTKTIPSSVKSVKVAWDMVGNGEYLFDAAELRDGGAGLTAATDPATYDFVETENYETKLSSTDVFATTSDQYASVALWGDQTDIVDDSNIATDADASRYANVRLLRTATPINQPNIETAGYAYPFYPGMYIRAVGKDGALTFPQPLPVFEVQGEWTARGLLKIRPVVGSERISEERINKEVIQREIQRLGYSKGTGAGLTSGGSALGGGTTDGGSVGMTDASTTNKGAVYTSVAPASAGSPIVVGVNDPLVHPYRLVSRWTTATAPTGTITLDGPGMWEIVCLASGDIVMITLPEPVSLDASLDRIQLTFCKDDGAAPLGSTRVRFQSAGSGTVAMSATPYDLTPDQGVITFIIRRSQNDYMILSRTI